MGQVGEPDAAGRPEGHPDRSGGLVLTLPMGDSPIAGIASDDIGRVALSILRRGEEFVGRTVCIAGDIVTGKEIAAALGDALGEPVEYRPVTHDQFVAMGTAPWSSRPVVDRCRS